MTASRPTTALLLLCLACSSSQSLPPGDATAGAGGDGSISTSSISDGPGNDAPGAVSPLPDASPDLSPPVDTGGMSAIDTAATAEAGVCTAAPETYGPFPSCAPGTAGSCDLVCQARCGCGQRCQLQNGVAACRTQAGPFLDTAASCNAANDQCKPGLLCLQESPTNTACGSRCYRHCRTDGDCQGGAKCAIEVQFGGSTISQRLCTSPSEACDPWGPARCRDTVARPSPLFGCFVLREDANSTTCECAGTLKIGSACTFEHECEPGAECVLDGGVRSCRRVCNAQLVVGVNPGPCPAGQFCTPFPGSAKYGFCK